VKFWRWLFWMALLLAACAPSFQDCPRSEVRCAVLLMHPWEEGTLSRQTWNALQAAQQAGQLQGAWKVIVRDARDRERELRWMAEQGIDLIITLSPSWQEETQRVARQFPQARFIALDQSPPPQALANLTLILIPYDQLGFLAGTLAARVTHTRRVAAICEADFIASVREACDGFVHGAGFADANVFVYREHRQGSPDRLFQDEKWGRQTADKFVRQGADVVFAYGGATGEAALEQAALERAWVIGIREDLYDALPRVRQRLIGAALPQVEELIANLMARAAGTSWPATARAGLMWAPFRGYGESLPLSLRSEMELLRLQLQAGTIQTGVAP
jgi:basic membrane lipoprotein Med (substrate-binding protein (PBP1-ABC) superfamily)